MKLYIKWSNLTDSQKHQVESFYKDRMKDDANEKKVVLNQGTYSINSTTGDFAPQKDF
jgi:hypothetical protein